MGKQYAQLTYEERIAIRVLRKEGKSLREIARLLGRSPSTISREVKRNSGQRGYRPLQAEENARERRRPEKRYKLTAEVRAYIESRLRFDLSPEQISETMAADVGVKVSHEWIYLYIYADRENGGDLYKHLRVWGKKQRRKRYGKKDRRGKIPNRRPISERPEIVEKRERVGDFEADLVSGARHRGYIVSLVDRKSRMTLLGHVQRKTARAVASEIVRLLRPHQRKTHTLTFDNGLEFAEHERIGKLLECETYFARPYASCDRGTNENTNGLVRQYFPKTMDLREVTRAELQRAQDRLNYRPRKVLNYTMPADNF